MADFFERSAADPEYWRRLSDGAVQRIQSRYTWSIYASRMVSLCQVYSFWKHITSLERRENKRYLEAIYILLMRPMVDKVRTRDWVVGRVELARAWAGPALRRFNIVGVA